MINVVIVDDDKTSRFGIKVFLKDNEITVIGEADNGADAIRLIGQQQPDVILLDFYLPDITGIQVCDVICRRFPQIKIIFLTGTRHLSILKRLISTAAVGILTKHEPNAVVEAIKFVYKGKRYVQPDLTHDLLEYMNRKNIIDALSEREHQILILAAQGKKIEEIAANFHISPKTVSNLKCNGMKKIGVKNIAELRYILFDLANRPLVESSVV